MSSKIGGISKTIFIAGILATVLGSSSLTYVASSQWGSRGGDGELLLDLQARLEALEAKFPVTYADIANETIRRENIMDSQITTEKLVPNVIPCMGRYATSYETTTSKAPVTIPDMTCTITLEEGSMWMVISTISAEFNQYADQETGGYGSFTIGAKVGTSPGGYPSYIHILLEKKSAVQSFTFYAIHGPGTHQIEIEWAISGGTGIVVNRVLTVMALPII